MRAPVCQRGGAAAFERHAARIGPMPRLGTQIWGCQRESRGARADAAWCARAGRFRAGGGETERGLSSVAAQRGRDLTRRGLHRLGLGLLRRGCGAQHGARVSGGAAEHGTRKRGPCKGAAAQRAHTHPARPPPWRAPPPPRAPPPALRMRCSARVSRPPKVLLERPELCSTRRRRRGHAKPRALRCAARARHAARRAAARAGARTRGVGDRLGRLVGLDRRGRRLHGDRHLRHGHVRGRVSHLGGEGSGKAEERGKLWTGPAFPLSAHHLKPLLLRSAAYASRVSACPAFIAMRSSFEKRASAYAWRSAASTALICCALRSAVAPGAGGNVAAKACQSLLLRARAQEAWLPTM